MMGVIGLMAARSLLLAILITIIYHEILKLRMRFVIEKKEGMIDALRIVTRLIYINIYMTASVQV